MKRQRPQYRPWCDSNVTGFGMQRLHFNSISINISLFLSY